MMGSPSEPNSRRSAALEGGPIGGATRVDSKAFRRRVGRSEVLETIAWLTPRDRSICSDVFEHKVLTADRSHDSTSRIHVSRTGGFSGSSSTRSWTGFVRIKPWGRLRITTSSETSAPTSSRENAVSKSRPSASAGDPTSSLRTARVCVTSSRSTTSSRSCPQRVAPKAPPGWFGGGANDVAPSRAATSFAPTG